MDRFDVGFSAALMLWAIFAIGLFVAYHITEEEICAEAADKHIALYHCKGML